MKVCEALLELADPRPEGEPVKRAIERDRANGAGRTGGHMIFGTGRPAGSRNMRLTQLRMRCGSSAKGKPRMNFMNYVLGLPALNRGWPRRTRTFIARILITHGKRCADLAEYVAPWIGAGHG